MTDVVSGPAPRKRGSWTQEKGWWLRENRLDRLKVLHAGKLTAKQIAEQLGTTKNAVIGMLRRTTNKPIGLNPRKSRAKPKPVEPIPEPTTPRPPIDYEAVLLALGISPAPSTIIERLDALMTLIPKKGRCAWPIGHPGTSGFRYCDAKAEMLSRPYCAEHNAASEPAGRGGEGRTPRSHDQRASGSS